MQPRYLVDSVRAFCVAVSLLSALSVQAHPVLRCRMLQGDSAFIHEVVPTRDPYTFAPFDIRKRFRINAVVIGDAQRVDYVKLYAYYYQHGQPVIAHMTHYASPLVQADEQQSPLTGLQRVYSPPYGFELQYSCVLFERPTGVAQ
jgi:hypothetical protein